VDVTDTRDHVEEVFERLEHEAALDLPGGYRLWQPGDTDPDLVPRLSEDAYYGVIGEYLDQLRGQSEAGLPAVGMSIITSIGTLIGRKAVVRVGPYVHGANLFALIIGESSIGAKGSAEDATDRFVNAIRPDFATRHAFSGFGSGEALVEAIADGAEPPNEKCRMISESEFSALLRVSRRESSILSEIIRKGFDRKPIQHRTKKGGAVTATDHHLSVLGSITPAELSICSTELDLENGWLNRFVLTHTEMTETLPFGGYVDHRKVVELAARVVAALDRLDRPTVQTRQSGVVEYELREGSPVGDLWDPWYREHRTGSGKPRVAALTRRQHVQALRLMLIFAVLAEKPAFSVDMFRAATAWTDYSVASCARYFGGGHLGGPAGKLLAALRDAGPEGLTFVQQHAVFGYNLLASTLANMRADLEGQQLAHTYKRPTGGRSKTVTVAITPTTRSH
jgi:hypothetical protein